MRSLQELAEKTALREGAIALGLLLLWGALLGVPLLVKGFPVDGHDFWAHTTWGGHFARQFWYGDLYPRWLMDHNEGLGSPTFFFYPPLPFWLTALLAPLFPGESAPVSALAWVATTMLVLSGWFAYLWLRDSVPAPAAVFAAAVYQVAPYHLLIDLYQRAALAEFCAMTWFPLILLAAGRASRPRSAWILLLATGTALLALTHVLSLLMFSPLVPAYAALASEPGRRLRAVVQTALGMALGLGLSGAYLVPALTLQRHVNMQVLWQGWGHYRQYLYDWELMLASGGHIFHMLLLLTLLSSVVLAALLWRLATGPGRPNGGAGADRADTRLAHFWMLVVLASAFLLTRASDFVWQLLAPLQRIQFPWRLAILITVALTALAAYGAASLRPGMAPGRRSLVLAGVCIVALWLMLTTRNGLEILRQTPQPELNPVAQDAWEYKPRWVQAEDFQRAVRQSKGPDGRIPKAALDGSGRLDVVRWRPRDVRLQVEAPRDTVLTIYQFYFPGWQALLDGKTRVQVQPSQPHGLVTLPLPAGSRLVELRLRMTPNERNGWLLTCASAIIWTAYLLLVGLRLDARLALPAFKRSSKFALALVAMAGAVFIAWLLPVAMLDPRSIEWLLEGYDNTQAWLGWQYFRRETWLWPPGLVAGYGMEMGSSIVFTDSIPFVALTLKTFHAWLPPSFQYFGLWAVACGALAAAFAYRALHRATRHQAAALAGALFAASSVFMTIRFIGHFALAGHWLIWWALSIYFSDESRRSWLQRAACLIIAAGVHAYLFVLVLAIVAADVARRWLQSREPVRSQIIGRAIAVAALTAAALWAYGYFVFESAKGDPRIYGTYGLPLNALAWRSNPAMEGAVYIGAGALAAVTITMVLSAWYWRDTMRVLSSHVFLLIATVGVTAVAITHRVYWGDALLTEIPLPSSLLARLAVFRGSGRFGWLLAYLAMFASLATIAARLPRTASSVLIALLALLQLVDFAPHYVRLRQHLEASVSSPQTYKRLADPRWPELVADHSMVLVAPMQHAAPYWRELGLLASAQGKPINVGQFARVHWPSFAPAYDRILAELKEGRPREGALYVITQPERVMLADHLIESCSLTLDGLRVVAASLCKGQPAAQ